MSSVLSANASIVLKAVLTELPMHGAYYSLIDIKNGIEGKKFEHVHVSIIEDLIKKGITSAHVEEVIVNNRDHMKLLQKYLIAQMNNGASIDGAIKDVGSLLENTFQADKESLAGQVQAEGINELDKAFAFDIAKVNAINALSKFNVTPEIAFGIINSSRGEFVSALPDNLESIARRLEAILFTIASEQYETSLESILEDVRNVLNGQSSVYGFKYDYTNAMLNLKGFIEEKMKGISAADLAKAIVDEKFLRKIELDSIVARADEANGLIFNSIGNHMTLPAELMPKRLADANIIDLQEKKMNRVYKGFFLPWFTNHTYMDYPTPACPPVVHCPVQQTEIQARFAGTQGAYHEGLAVGMVGGLIMAGAVAYFAKPVYNNVIKPLTNVSMKVCSDLGVTLFGPAPKDNAKLSPRVREIEEQDLLLSHRA